MIRYKLTNEDFLDKNNYKNEENTNINIADICWD